MEIFAIKDFYKHAIIITTNVKKDDDDFENDLNDTKGSIVKSLKEDSIRFFYAYSNNKKFERAIKKQRRIW